MLVEDHREAGGSGIVDHPVEPLQPGILKLAILLHVAKGLEVDPDEIEAGIVDRLEIGLLEAGVRRIGPDRIVAEHVDAAVQRRRLGRGRVSANTNEGGEEKREESQQLHGHLRTKHLSGSKTGPPVKAEPQKSTLS